MNRLACSFALLWTLSQPLLAQEIGEPFAVDLSGTETTLTLDFSEHDYELILYSFNATEPPDQNFNRVFSFTVTGAFAGSKSIVSQALEPMVPAGRERLEFELRKREQALARRLQQAGGYRPSAPKVVPQEIGSTRRFVFPTHGNVTRDTITAALVATSDRAHAYVDVADTSRLSVELIQAQVDYFSAKTHPLVTSAIGDESDVDNDDRVHFLYTHLVDEVGGFLSTSKVGGFYDAASVLRNLSDLIYINPNIDPNRVDAVIAHEFQHLISFNQHVLIRGGAGEESWLNEGLSHVCEDLIGRHDAHNRRYVDFFFVTPESWSLRASVVNNGVRGAVYLFLRSLMEEFGSDILARLVQTDKAGIANIEHATGQPFAGIFDRHLSRLFLSGSGLNSTFNYTTPFLVDTTTGARVSSPPKDLVVSPQSPSVSDKIPSLSVAYLRLLSNQSQETVTIQTDAEGDFRAQLIPVPRHFFFGTTLETPHAGPFFSYQPIHITGTVPDPSVFELWFKFIRGDRDRTLESRGPVINGHFSHRLFFSHEQAGEYQIEIWLARPRRPWISAGTFYPLRIEKGEGTAPIPVDFFDDITFSSPIPLEYTTGQAVRIAGIVSDPSAFRINLTFWEYVEEVEDFRETIAFHTPVTNGRFSTAFLFSDEQAGEYQFRVEIWRANNQLRYLGRIFIPIIIKKGQGVAPLPVDFFDGITFAAPLPVEYTIGQITPIAGTVSDPSVANISFRFRPIDDPVRGVNLRVPVTNGQFSTTLRLSPGQPVGDYELDIFTKESGSLEGAWPWVGSFSPITVKASPDYDGDGTDLPFSITLETTHVGPFFSYQPIHIAGTVPDSSVSELWFKFIRGDRDRRLESRCPVIDGRFSHRLFFSHEQAGEYQIEIWTQPVPLKVGTNYPLRIEKGEGTAPIPVDFFDDITFSSPIPLEYTTGQAVRIAGTVSDPSAFRIDLTFWEYVEKVEGQGYYRTAIAFDTPVTNGRFSKTFRFSDEQAGEYQFRVQMWRASNRNLPWYLEGIFSPITVKAAPSPDFDGDGTVGFTDFIAFAAAFGKSSGDEDFDARFDLDGDGTVGFTDFIAFAAAFGRPLEN